MPIMNIVKFCRGCHSVKAMLKVLGMKPLAVEVGELDGNCLKYFPQYKEYSTLNLEHDFCGSGLETDVSGHKRDKLAKADFPVDTVEERLGGWSIDSSPIKGESPTHIGCKRNFEMRVKKYVKQQYSNGKFNDLLTNVIATPEVLKLAYQSVTHNLNLITPDMTGLSTVDANVICFSSIAKQLVDGNFDVKSNIQTFFLSKNKPEYLVLPSLQLKAVQEAIRMVLEVVYRPQFSKISHSCRSGRGQHSALKYIQNQIHNPDWWFSIVIQKKLDASVFMKLVAAMKENIHDDSLYKFLGQMFDADVLNVEFGGFPKGQGYPQEGIWMKYLLPFQVLMNLPLKLEM